MIINLDSYVEYDRLRTDRVELTLNGYFDEIQPYVMKGIEIFAE